jgi:Protein of unknown function (DUF4238)
VKRPNQHYISQFYLKGFKAAKVGGYRIYQYERMKEDFQLREIKDVASETDYYTFKSGDGTPRLAAYRATIYPLALLPHHSYSRHC